MTGKNEGHNTPYPVALGADVAKWRARARVEKLDRDQMRAYGEAVGIAIRKLQRSELMRALTPTPSLKRPPIARSPSPLNVPYSVPNPFRMVGDPNLGMNDSRGSTKAEKLLYQHALEQKHVPEPVGMEYWPI